MMIPSLDTIGFLVHTVLLTVDLQMTMGSHSDRPCHVGAHEYENVQPSSQKGNVLSVGTCRSMCYAGCHARQECHRSIRDAYPQGWPGVARPSKVRTKNIGREEC